MIEVPPTAMTLNFNPRRDIVMTHTHAKGQGHRSLGSKVRVETDGRTEAIVLPPMQTRSVIKSVIISSNHNVVLCKISENRHARASVIS